MSADKYPSIFSRQMVTIVYIFSSSGPGCSKTGKIIDLITAHFLCSLRLFQLLTEGQRILTESFPGKLPK